MNKISIWPKLSSLFGVTSLIHISWIFSLGSRVTKLEEAVYMAGLGLPPLALIAGIVGAIQIKMSRVKARFVGGKQVCIAGIILGMLGNAFWSVMLYGWISERVVRWHPFWLSPPGVILLAMFVWLTFCLYWGVRQKLKSGSC